jgi:hypothetical protein
MALVRVDLANACALGESSAAMHALVPGDIKAE